MITKTFFNVEFTNEFLSELSELYSTNIDKDITIYISSYGGSEWVSRAAIDIVNKNSKHTTIIGYGALNSASFNFFMEIKCSKNILPLTYGMYHKARYNLDYNSSVKPYYEVDKYLSKVQIPLVEKYYLQKLQEWGLNEKEIKDYKNDLDVYFPYERMLELINKNK